MEVIQVLLVLFGVSTLKGEIGYYNTRREKEFGGLKSEIGYYNTKREKEFGSNEILELETGSKNEGDMVVSRFQNLMLKGLLHMDMVLEDLDRWPGSVIPYEFQKGYKGKDQLKDAFAAYAKVSCIRFREKTPEDNDWLYIYEGRGCWSFVGRIGGKQHVSLPWYCRTTKGTPIHELLHALGFYHEQSRGDRDKYITIMWQNIKPKARANFEKHESQSFGYPYDFDSVMHYSGNSFSKNGKPTIVIKDRYNHPGVHLGQRKGFSDIDAKQLNAHYCKGSRKRAISKDNRMRLSERVCDEASGVGCDDAGIISRVPQR